MSEENAVQSEGRRRSRWMGLLRLLLAFALFGIVLALVPIKDHIEWPKRLGSEVFTGSLVRDGATVRIERSDGSFVELRSSGAGTAANPVWSTARIKTAPGVSEQEFPLDQKDLVELRDQPGQGLWTTLKNLRPGWFGLALLAYLLAAALSFVRWHRLLLAVGVQASMGRVQKLGYLGLFFSNIIPGMTGGDLVKAVYVARDHRGQRAVAVLSVLVDRAVGLYGLALFASVVLMFHLQRFLDLALVVFAVLAGMTIASCALFSRRLRKLLRVESLISKLPGGGMFQKLDGAVLLFREQIGAVLRAVALSLVVHALVLTSIGLVGVSLSLPLDWFSYYALAPIPLIVQALPVSPAGIGVGEAAYVYVLASKTGLVTASMALGLSLSYRAVQLLISLVGGALLLFEKEKPLTRAEMEGEPRAEPSPPEWVSTAS